jgi:hypothetical protein
MMCGSLWSIELFLAIFEHHESSQFLYLADETDNVHTAE